MIRRLLFLAFSGVAFQYSLIALSASGMPFTSPLAIVHEARFEFYSRQELPASTLIRIDGYVSDGALIEIEADVVMKPKQ
jgi:hypothetical protein